MWFDYYQMRNALHFQTEQTKALIAHKQIQAERLERFQNEYRPIRVFPYEGMDAKWGVERLATPPSSKRFLITGTGRCGTTYLSRLLAIAGIDVPHGKMGWDGTTSHYFMVDHDWYPVITYNPEDVSHIGERRSDYEFEKVIYLVREPLSTIRSLSIFFGKIDEAFYEESGIVPVETFRKHRDLIWRGMVLYYYVNRYILETHPEHLLIHMEDIRSLRTWRTLLEYMNECYTDMPSLPAQNKMGDIRFSETEIQMRSFYKEKEFMQGYNAFPRDVTYSYLERLDKELLKGVIDITQRLGYPIVWS